MVAVRYPVGINSTKTDLMIFITNTILPKSLLLPRNEQKLVVKYFCEPIIEHKLNLRLDIDLRTKKAFIVVKRLQEVLCKEVEYSAEDSFLDPSQL